MGADEEIKEKLYIATRTKRSYASPSTHKLDAEIKQKTGLNVEAIISALDYGINCPPTLYRKVSEGLDRVGASIGDILQTEASVDRVHMEVQEECKARAKAIAEKRFGKQ